MVFILLILIFPDGVVNYDILALGVKEKKEPSFKVVCKISGFREGSRPRR